LEFEFPPRKQRIRKMKLIHSEREKRNKEKSFELSSLELLGIAIEKAFSSRFLLIKCLFCYFISSSIEFRMNICEIFLFDIQCDGEIGAAEKSFEFARHR
jgi:hypothetical protein